MLVSYQIFWGTKELKMLVPLPTKIGGSMEDREFTIETPVGSISSDSGNHMVDIVSVVGVILMLYVCKKLIGKYL